MAIEIPDGVVRASGLPDPELLIEIACRLYDAGILQQPDAVRLSRLTRLGFWEALQRRNLSWVHIVDADLDREMQVLRACGTGKA